MARRINNAGLQLIKSFESLRLDAYLDTGGVPTIGWGHTKGVKMGQTINEQVASGLLMDDLEAAEAAVERFITVPLNDNQFAALVSFTFNVGTEALRRSTLRKKLNAGDYKAVPGQLALWVNDNGKKLAGLVRRRKAEADLWNTPSVRVVPSPAPTSAQKPAPAPTPAPTLEPAPMDPPAGGKGIAAAAALILAFTASFWATVTDAWQHFIAWIEGASQWLW